MAKSEKIKMEPWQDKIKVILVGESKDQKWGSVGPCWLNVLLDPSLLLEKQITAINMKAAFLQLKFSLQDGLYLDSIDLATWIHGTVIPKLYYGSALEVSFEVPAGTEYCS